MPHRKVDSMETSKILLLFTCVIFAATWAVAVFSWFTGRPFPSELVAWVTGLTAAEGCCYLIKSCIENKVKIETDYLGKKNER